MPNRNITNERSIEINDPNYLYQCKKCGEIKLNTEYSRNKTHTKRGRQYVTQCKKCRVLYMQKDSTQDIIKKVRYQQRRKHRINIIFNSSKGNAKRRGLAHTISIEYLKDIFEQQKGLCFYTNKPMLIDTRDVNNSNDSVSVDRIDSSKGYIEGNIVLCRWIINRMKNEVSHSIFLELISEIYTNFNKPCQQEDI